MADICGDNRFELIEKYKQKLLDATNISDSPEEMAVIDNILFRFWQMGWLKGELFGKTEQLESYLCCHEKDHVADSGKMVGDLISRARAIETVRKAKSIGQAHRMLMQLPPAQSEEPSHEAVKEYCRKRCLSIVDTALLEKYLPPAQLAQDLTNGCTDTISRRAALNTAEWAYKACEGDLSYYHNLLVAVLMDLTPAQKWIPCDMGEPDEDMECWVTVKTTDALYRGNFTKRYGERRDKGFITSGGFMWWNTALAWMPIYEPEPYRPEGEEHGTPRSV